ncbi:hypothetical protein [Natrialba swarupiae]|uniref:Uncharacterized protein n=1 Tax=Natrialba swarupiae TaxID=2448032 RepID=A0A5D5AKT6_9EURY|nr:hypothetical protein [Natrialba swarupiae]MCW8172795.1 hypothetical protein [Natrialba swarupiae]TYT61794.1 hypothetical protein FYC77_11150 [Natrialba swarupiae]
MSSDVDRDLAAELETPEAGQAGIPVDAVCVGCGRTRVKRAGFEAVKPSDFDPETLEAADLTSFKHVCHRCQSGTWWNPVAVLTGLLESERGE